MNGNIGMSGELGIKITRKNAPWWRRLLDFLQGH